MKTIIIIPAYNEDKSIYQVVSSIKAVDSKIDIMVVNDGSKDNTEFEAKKAGAGVISLPVNLGIGGAVQTGYIYASCLNYDCAVQIDGDGQHNPRDLPKLLEVIKNGQADMVIGSRFIKKTGYRPPFFRKIGIGFFSRLVRSVTGVSIDDTTSGYRATNKKIIKLFAKYYPSDYPEVETVVYALKNKAKVKEISVDMNYRKEGKSSISPINSIYYAIKVSFCLLFFSKGGEAS